MKLWWGFLFLSFGSICLVNGKVSSDEMAEEEEFEEAFHELFSDEEEKEKHAEALAEAEKEIEEHNAKYEEGEYTWKEGINELSDVPKEELEKYFEGGKVVENSRGGFYYTGGLLPPEAERVETAEDKAFFEEFERMMNSSRQSIPSTFDSRHYGMVSSVKSQGACGSCAAFAATSQLETCMKRVGGSLPDDLAEQQMLDCGYNPSKTANGCEGAWPKTYNDWVKDSNGGEMTHENSYPYKQKLGSCQNWKSAYKTGAKATGSYAKWNPTDEDIKKYIYSYGSVVGMLYSSDFGNYRSGVFSGCSSREVNHAIQIIGYGTEGGVPYWLIKNSWGSWWGDNGYIKLRRGNNECGINKAVTFNTCSKTGGATSAPVTKAPPTQPPASQTCDVHGYWTKAYKLTGTYYITGSDGARKYIKCTNDICSPYNTGYVRNACVYICGQSTCAKY